MRVLNMGGYACIKYSKMINATNTVAVSPYFSVNADDLEMTDSLQRKRVAYEVASAKIVISNLTDNMKITPEDCQGRLFVIYNPQEEVDSFNARFIQKRLPSVYVLPGYGIPHAAFDDLKVPHWFHRLNDCLEKVRENSLFSLRRLLYSDPDAIENIFIRACRKHPIYCLRALISKRVVNLERYDLVAGNDIINLKLHYFLFISGYRAEGLAYLTLMMERRIGAPAPRTFKTVLDNIDRNAFADEEDALLVSHHGGVLSFDVETRTVKCGSCTSVLPGMVRIRLRRKNGVAQLLVPIARDFLEIKLHDAKVGSAKRFQEHKTLVASHQDGRISILDSDGGFLSVMPDYSVNANALEVDEWEKFVPIPLVRSGMNSLRGCL